MKHATGISDADLSMTASTIPIGISEETINKLAKIKKQY